MRNKKIADIIRELRLAAELTQQQLAVRMGAAVSSIANYEAGAVPNRKALASLRDIALETGRNDLAEIFDIHLAMSNGIVPPFYIDNIISDRGVEHSIGVELLERILKKPGRFAAFLEFAKPEIEEWKAIENKFREKVENNTFSKEERESIRKLAKLAESLGTLLEKPRTKRDAAVKTTKS
jgi:transcriptional regulator with XRE-family HTH domain